MIVNTNVTKPVRCLIGSRGPKLFFHLVFGLDVFQISVSNRTGPLMRLAMSPLASPCSFPLLAFCKFNTCIYRLLLQCRSVLQPSVWSADRRIHCHGLFALSRRLAREWRFSSAPLTHTTADFSKLLPNLMTGQCLPCYTWSGFTDLSQINVSILHFALKRNMSTWWIFWQPSGLSTQLNESVPIFRLNSCCHKNSQRVRSSAFEATFLVTPPECNSQMFQAK
jgi:hypothetical protein